MSNIKQTTSIEDGCSQIFRAAHDGDKNSVMCLYENGTKLNLFNKYGYSPLSLAVASENEETFKYILQVMLTNYTEDLKVDKTSFGLTCFFGCSSFVKLFLSLNIFDINDTVLYGLTPLLLAVTNGKVETAKILIAAGANVFATNLQSQTAYDIALYRKDNKMLALLSEKSLLSPKTPLAPLDNYRTTQFFSTFLTPLRNVNKRKDINNVPKYSFNKNLTPINLFKKYYQEDKNEEHAFCQCHYINSLLSPKIFHQQKKKSKILYKFQKAKSKETKIEKNKKGQTCLPWVRRKLDNRTPKLEENEDGFLDENTFKANHTRMEENLKITQILTKLKLEEYISTFIMQEFDANTIFTLTEEDLKTIGINDKEKCNEILGKINSFNPCYCEN